MDSISFQNGFVCGIATKGLVKSGAVYEPVAYNDAGVYNFFYLDFRRVLEPFSMGMFSESISVSASSALPVTDVKQYSDTVYKVFCNISNQPKGVCVTNKKSTRLHFWNGETVPAFSVWFSVAGQAAYIDAGYLFDKCEYSSERFYTSTNESKSITLADTVSINTISESTTFAPPFMNSTIKETANVVLT